MHLTLVGGQLDGELTLVIAQHQFLANIQVFIQNHATIVGLANTQLLSEEFQTTEDRRLVIIDAGDEFGVDDIDTIHTTHQYQTIGGDTD